MPDRTFDSDQDSGRVWCRHTALEPLVVSDDGKGGIRIVKAKCGNCDAILFEKSYTNRLADAHKTEQPETSSDVKGKGATRSAIPERTDEASS